MAETTTTTRYEYAQPVKITLVRGQRGNYGWEVTVQAENSLEALAKVDEIDLVLRAKYANHVPARPEEESA
jgi:hypothetical protein